MEDKEVRSDRARIHENTRDVYNALNGSDVEQSPFVTNKDIFMLAACIGYKNEKRLPLETGKKEGIRMEVFSEKDRDILKGIALAETNDIHVLDRSPNEIMSGDVLTIAEEYAHGGIDELRSLIVQKPGLALWNLVDLIKNQ